MLSRTYRPSADLAPYIRRFYVFEAPLPDEVVVEDFLLAETAFVRCLLRGDWSAETRPGEWNTAGNIVFFGANSGPLKVRVKGGFAVTGFAIRPSGWHTLFSSPHNQLADQMRPLQELWGELADRMIAGVSQAVDDEGQLAAMERCIRERLELFPGHLPDPQMAQFEIIARTDSTIRIEDAAGQLGLSVRQLERRCLAAFGLTPKAVLRRSRFLDAATALRGFSNPSEIELGALRYYDQSHMNREFRRYTGMTPRVFSKAVTPLQTAGLKLREESRFED
ncbi:helix-turn-helix domain-containing protein [Sphingorhabdus contaminans]|uniref:helix-turn-helix domain-containing protein n=1 Tax=Sphingorhabdus contaminans TaxID=1343899 RepID=UPI003D271C73